MRPERSTCRWRAAVTAREPGERALYRTDVARRATSGATATIRPALSAVPTNALHGRQVVGQHRRCARAARTGRPGAAAAAGARPVARSTASGNLAGCAVASVTTGPCSRAGARSCRTRRCRRPCAGRAACPSRAYTRPMHGERLGVVDAGGPEHGRRGTRRAGRPRPSSRPVARKRCSCSAVMPPSRPFISNSSRSKFDDTWMSMLGLSVGTTSRVLMSLSLRNRVRMSLVLRRDDELVDRRTHPLGDPARRARCRSCRWARRTSTGAARARRQADDVVDDLGHHPGPVDGVHRRRAACARGTAASLNIAFTRSWQSSNVPSIGDGVHVRRVDRGHLPALHVAGAAVRVEDDDVDVARSPSRRRSPPSRCRRWWRRRS